MRRDAKTYLWVLGGFLLSRIALWAWGVRFEASYDWQHFHDLDLLRDHLWESLYYSHAFTPFMNLLVATVEGVAPDHALLVYQVLFTALGAAWCTSLAYLLRALGIAPRWTVGTVWLFACSPAFIYFEHFLHYEFISAALLSMAAASFHRALALDDGRGFGWFFGLLVVTAYARLTFHLVWFVGLMALCLMFAPTHWRRILRTAAVPLLLVTAMYAKNYVEFGFFGASSRTGFTAALMTTRQLSAAERKQWVRQGKLHPVSLYSVYSGAERYRAHMPASEDTGIAVLDRMRRKGGQVNYNHHSLIAVSRQLLEDSRSYLQQRPRAYLHTVLKGVKDYFNPTTRWHPRDPKGSPHLTIRERLEPWERIYNTTLHSPIVAPFGLYLCALPLWIWACARAARRLLRARLRGHASDKLVVFMVLNALYVPAISCLVAIGELERYRLLVEGFMWATTCWAARELFQVGYSYVRSRQGAQAAPPADRA